MCSDITVNFFLDGRRELQRKGAGIYRVMGILRYRGRDKHFATPFCMTQDDWDNLHSGRKIRSEAVKDTKLQMEAYRTKAMNIIETLHPFSYDKFKELMLGKGVFSKVENRDVYRLFDDYIGRLSLNRCYRTVVTYTTTKNSLRAFRPKLYLEDVTPDFLQRYENHLTDEGKSATTVSIYFRCLRCILNEAIEQGLMRREDYPFGRRRYVVPEPKQAKIALQPQQIRQILDYRPETAEEQRAKDIWVFSYLCGGMNINDICRLKRSNIQGDNLIFYRHKTKETVGRNAQPINILLQEQAMEIIGRMHGTGEHLLPLLDDVPADKEFKVIMQFTKTTNKYLKRIGRKLGIARLTTQTARHSFATTMMNGRVPMAFISKSMGHSNIKTTEIYLGSFTMNEAAQYGEVLTAV